MPRGRKWVDWGPEIDTIVCSIESMYHQTGWYRMIH